MSATERVSLFEAMRVFNDWDGVASQLVKVNALAKRYFETDFDPSQLIGLAQKARRVDTAAIASMYTSGLDIKNAIFDARVKAISYIVPINT